MRRVARRPVAQRDPDPDDEEYEEPDEDEEEDEDEPEDVVRQGWSGYRETKAKSGAYADFLTLQDGQDPVLLKFLEKEPFASYRQHWIEGLKSTKKRSWVCVEDDCPLCDAGDDPGFRIAFNVLVVSEGKPINKVWEVGPSLAEQIEGKAKDKRTGPLDRHDIYFAAHRTGKKSKTRYNIDAVKARDLEDDWEMQPLDEAVVERYKKKMFDRKVVRVPKREKLKEIAAELQDADYDDDDDDD